MNVGLYGSFKVNVSEQTLFFLVAQRRKSRFGKRGARPWIVTCGTLKWTVQRHRRMTGLDPRREVKWTPGGQSTQSQLVTEIFKSRPFRFLWGSPVNGRVKSEIWGTAWDAHFFSFLFFFFLSFYSHTFSIWKFPGQGSNHSCSCWPTPQPQQCRIQAVSATYTTAHGNTRSLTHWTRPGMELHPHRDKHQVLNLESHNRNSWGLHFC